MEEEKEAADGADAGSDGGGHGGGDADELDAEIGRKRLADSAALHSAGSVVAESGLFITVFLSCWHHGRRGERGGGESEGRGRGGWDDETWTKSGSEREHENGSFVGDICGVVGGERRWVANGMVRSKRKKRFERRVQCVEKGPMSQRYGCA